MRTWELAPDLRPCSAEEVNFLCKQNNFLPEGLDLGQITCISEQSIFTIEILVVVVVVVVVVVQ